MRVNLGVGNGSGGREDKVGRKLLEDVAGSAKRKKKGEG